MKLSALTTDKAADVLVEITPYISNIVKDETFTNKLGKAIRKDELTEIGVLAAGIDRLADFVPFLLKDHRTDVYGILSVVNEKTVDEVAAQNIMVTMNETREILKDEDFVSFFKSFASQGKTA